MEVSRISGETMLTMGQATADAAQATAAIGRANAGSGPETLQHAKLVRAAHEFEGQMMKELLKPMTASDGLTGQDGDDPNADADSGSSGALGEFATEALGQALSLRGGFGIADQIIKELSQSGNQPGNGRVTKNRNLNTEMRAYRSLK